MDAVIALRKPIPYSQKIYLLNKGQGWYTGNMEIVELFALIFVSVSIFFGILIISERKFK